jgi:hypothetical protein
MIQADGTFQWIGRRGKAGIRRIRRYFFVCLTTSATQISLRSSSQVKYIKCPSVLSPVSPMVPDRPASAVIGCSFRVPMSICQMLFLFSPTPTN